MIQYVIQRSVDLSHVFSMCVRYLSQIHRHYFSSRGSSSRRLGNDREGERSSHERDRDRDSFSRWRDRQYYGPRRWLETALKDSWEKDSGKRNNRTERNRTTFRELTVLSRLNFSDNKKKELASQSPLWISEELEWWHDRSTDPVPRFVQIASLYSELIAVSASGQLYQWKWTESEPYKNAEVNAYEDYALTHPFDYTAICKSVRHPVIT